MIRVGFRLLDFSSWFAQVSYIRNLFEAISSVENRKIEPVILISTNTDVTEININSGSIYRDQLFQINSSRYLIDKIQRKVFNTSTILNRIVNNNEIQVLSHSNIVHRLDNCRIVNWIPDFQHINLPKYFSCREIRSRNSDYIKLIQQSDVIVVSSKAALSDLEAFAPQAVGKACILSFVAQTIDMNLMDADKKTIELKYGFSGKYFFLPNQFWKHKNHAIVIEALRLLKRKDKKILVLCSGLMKDYRSDDHIKKLVFSIKNNGLEETFRILGLIPFYDLYYLMRNSVAVINPSLFEGWSTTIEECKSMGKSVILSDIVVHREQDPSSAIYFDPYNAEELAAILWEKWQTSNGGPEIALEIDAKAALKRRTQSFGETFQEIVMKSLG
jgi:glycosyltransferase involved in cell wall biosynthesis